MFSYEPFKVQNIMDELCLQTSIVRVLVASETNCKRYIVPKPICFRVVYRTTGYVTMVNYSVRVCYTLKTSTFIPDIETFWNL